VRKHYALAGIVVAVLVGALIVIAGSRSSDSGSSAAAQPGATASLPPGHPSIGASATSQPNYGKMVTSLEARYKKNPADTKTALALADAYLMNEQPAKAQHLYVKVLSRNPANTTAKVQLAMALHAGGDDAKALDLLTGVIKTDPNNQLAHYNLAILYFSQQKSDLAKAEWEKAAAIDPKTSIGISAQNFVNLMANGTGGPHPAASP
jgi:cytochrome c-type biogenesis protein CcmH/NrfG